MQNKRRIIYLAGFLFSIPIALTSYVNSSFLESFVDEKYIGLIYTIASIFTIFGLLEMPKVLTKLGNRKTTIYGILASFISLLFLALVKNSTVALLFFVLFFVSTNFVIASLDIFLEDFSRSKNIGSLRGMYLMIINLAWVLAQTISGSIISKSSYAGIYLFSAIFMALASTIFLISLKDFIDPIYKKIPIIKTIRSFRQNPNISKIYLISFILRFFFAWMIIYTPIYLREYLYLEWSQIGIIFTIMLLPFVLLDYPLGRLSDKIGEKKMLLIGFLFSIIFTLIIPFIHVSHILVWASILFGTRIGAATIEIMSDSYFFKNINRENADAISFFRNTGPLSFIIAPLLATIILIYVPSFKYLFFILSAILLYGFYISLRLKDTK